MIIVGVFSHFPGATATLSSNVDVNNFQAGGHRIGLALEIDQ